MKNSQLITSAYSALKIGALLSIFTTHTVSAIAAPECDEDAYEARVLSALSCQILRETFQVLADDLRKIRIMSAEGKVLPNRFLNNLDNLNNLDDWTYEEDILFEGIWRHYSMDCSVSETNRENLYLSVIRPYGSDNWLYEIGIDIEDSEFRNREISPTVDMFLTSEALKAAVKSFSQVMNGSELVELFEAGGFITETLKSQDGSFSIYRITTKQSVCSAFYRLYPEIEGLLATIKVDHKNRIIPE